ncbi:NUDIX hydrolase domain-like protein [Pisolithus marmoratus]|nr:NUDIX hydrolase domain-like protein [Pisolithus marmoratus]
MTANSASGNLTFLDLVNACDNFRLPANHRADVPASLSTQDTLVPWTLTQSPDSPVVGLLKSEIIELLREEGDGAWVIPDPASMPRSTYRVSFHSSIDAPAKRTDVMRKLCERWRDSGTIYQDIIGPKKWRNEMYPVYRNPFGVHRAHDPKAVDDSDDGNYAFELERSACALFGVVTYGVHMTIYQQTNGNEMQIWVPTRSRTKQTWPGYLDNSVAGGIPSGMSAFDSLVKEAAEEASIDEGITRKYARCVGSISYYLQTSAGWLQPEVQYVYDMKIPNDVDPTLFQPKPADGEVESFDLLPLSVVIDKMKQGLFKANCALALIDFLIRHGYLTPDNDPDFMEIVTRVHGRFHFDRW